MTTQVLPKDKSLSKFLTGSRTVDSMCRSMLFKKLKSLHSGCLTIQDFSATGAEHFSFGDPASPLKACLNVHRSSFYSRTLLGGSIGNGESYVDGDWDCQELTSLIRIFVLNRDLLQSIDEGFGSLLQPLQKMIHGLGRSNFHQRQPGKHSCPLRYRK